MGDTVIGAIPSCAFCGRPIVGHMNWLWGRPYHVTCSHTPMTLTSDDLPYPVTKTTWPKGSNVLPPETRLNIEISHPPSFRVTTVKHIDETFKLAKWQGEKIESLCDQMRRMNAGYRRKIGRLQRDLAAAKNGAASPDRLTAPQPKTGTDLSDLARRPGEQTGAGDRVSQTDAAAWWALLTSEVRKFWFQRITGWSVEGAMKAAFAEASGEREEPVRADVAPLDPAGNSMPGTPMFDSEASDG